MKRVARYDFQGRLDGVTRTPQGGIRATANLTRTGIFRYQTSDGAPFLELRPAEEVFAQDSLATLDTAPLTIGHPGEVTSANWRDQSVGHVIAGTVKENGKFVTADIAIQDADTCAKVESGELSELSCGYDVDLELTEGEHEGERFDAIQRNPRYNHVAIGGTNWGRAGSDVRIHLDSLKADYALSEMTIPAKRTDAPTNSDADNVRKDLDSARADNDRLRAERDSAIARADKAEAERDTARTALTENEKKAKEDASAFDARVEARVKLVTDAKTILGSDFDTKGKSDKEIRVAALTKVDPKFDVKDKSDGYLEARFDLAVPQVKSEQEDLSRIQEVVNTVNEDGNGLGNESPVDKARREMQERHANAWKPKK